MSGRVGKGKGFGGLCRWASDGARGACLLLCGGASLSVAAGWGVCEAGGACGLGPGLAGTTRLSLSGKLAGATAACARGPLWAGPLALAATLVAFLLTAVSLVLEIVWEEEEQGCVVANALQVCFVFRCGGAAAGFVLGLFFGLGRVEVEMEAETVPATVLGWVVGGGLAGAALGCLLLECLLSWLPACRKEAPVAFEMNLGDGVERNSHGIPLPPLAPTAPDDLSLGLGLSNSTVSAHQPLHSSSNSRRFLPLRPAPRLNLDDDDPTPLSSHSHSLTQDHTSRSPRDQLTPNPNLLGHSPHGFRRPPTSTSSSSLLLK